MRVQDLLDEALAVATGPVVAVLTERSRGQPALGGERAHDERRDARAQPRRDRDAPRSRAAPPWRPSPPTWPTSSEVAAVVAAAEAAARAASPAEEPMPFVARRRPHATTTSTPTPAATSVETLADVAAGLGRAFAQAEADGHLLYGFAEHIVETVYLASSTGLRRRGVDPEGRLELNGKSADLDLAPAWVGQQTRTFTDVDVDAPLRRGRRAARLGAAHGRAAARAATRRCCRPGPVADLMVYASWTASARDAEDGSNVYAAGEGRTRVGERLTPLPVTLLSDPAWPGEETLPFVAPHHVDRRDVVLLRPGPAPSGRSAGSTTGVLHRAGPQPRPRRGDRAAGDPGRAQPGHGRAAARPRWRR